MAAKTPTFRFSVVAAATLLSIAALSGCGGGGGSDPAPAQSDTTAPSVVSAQAIVLGSTTTFDLMTPGTTGVDTDAIFSVKYDERPACPANQPVFGSFGSVSGSLTCVDTLVTLVPSPAPNAGTRYDMRLTFSDVAGNQGVWNTWFTTAPVTPPPSLATVSLGAEPGTITVGSSATLTWATTNAASCVWTEGLSGSIDPAGGSVTVTPTVTTTYGAQCWNSANVATEVVRATVTVTPAPVKLSYQNVVLMLRASMLFRVDRTVPEAVLPDANTTPWGELYAVGIRAPRADCLVEVSGLDQKTGTEHRILYNPKTGEKTVDTSVAGLAWNRQTDYMFYSTIDRTIHPDWPVKLQMSEGWYHSPMLENWVLKFQDNAGVVTTLTTTTFFQTGQIMGLWSFSCKAP